MLTRRRSKLALEAEAEISPVVVPLTRKLKRKTNTPSPSEVPKKRSITKKITEQRDETSERKSVRKTERKDVQKLGKTVDPESFQSPQSQNGISSKAAKSPEAFACYKAIEQVLVTKYLDVHERLKLTFPAKCTQSLKKCSIEHARNHYIEISKNMTTSQTVLNNHQPAMFIHSVQMDVLEGKFPGRLAIQSLLELILCINEPPTSKDYEVKKVIEMSAFTIKSILGKFPPCWSAANKEYRTLLQAKGKKLITDSNELLNTRTLFEDMIFCIESFIQPPTKRVASNDNAMSNSTFNDSMFNDSQDLQCFSKWEQKNAHKYLFDNLPRDEKIDRIFRTLAMYVQLFETDLAMWTMRHLPNPSAKIFDSQKGPLIGSVLWSNGEPHQVNHCIKNILKLYVNYISIDFSSEHTHVLGRLVNIIFNVFDLNDFPSNNSDRIEYPQPTDKKSFFCDALNTTIFENSSCTVELWLKVIQVVEHPRLKLYLINALMTKIEHKPVTLHPKNIHTTLYELEKQYDDIFDKTNSHNNNVVKTKTSKQTTGDQSMKYPYLQRVTRKAASDLSYEQNAELLLIALNAYMKVFHVKEFQKYWENYEQIESDREISLKQYKAELKSFEQDPIEPFDPDAIVKLQKKSLDARVKALGQVNRIYGLNIINENDGLRMTLRVDIKKYREDAKFVDKIVTDLPKLHSKLGTLFPQPNQ